MDWKLIVKKLLVQLAIYHQAGPKTILQLTFSLQFTFSYNWLVHDLVLYNSGVVQPSYVHNWKSNAQLGPTAVGFILCNPIDPLLVEPPTNITINNNIDEGRREHSNGIRNWAVKCLIKAYIRKSPAWIFAC